MYETKNSEHTMLATELESDIANLTKFEVDQRAAKEKEEERKKRFDKRILAMTEEVTDTHRITDELETVRTSFAVIEEAFEESLQGDLAERICRVYT
jgi:hypothetical protein